MASATPVAATAAPRAISKFEESPVSGKIGFSVVVVVTSAFVVLVDAGGTITSVVEVGI